MDAITLLKDDHKATEKLLARYEKAGDRAFVTKRDAVADLVAQLTPTLAVTEQLFVPVTRDTVDDVDDVALECAERARILTWQLAEVDGMEPTDERFDARVTVLADTARTYRHAVEDRYYPKVRDALGRNALGELGEAMATVKEVAPTHPHPGRPRSPIASFVTGTAVGAVDRTRDTVWGAAQGAWNAAADVVARLQGRETAVRPSPTGSPDARSVADRVRAAIDDALDEAEATGRTTSTEAVGAVKSTTKAARSAVADTASSARRGAKRTVNTARASAERTREAAVG